jgi:hypothetical protein
VLAKLLQALYPAGWHPRTEEKMNRRRPSDCARIAPETPDALRRAALISAALACAGGISGFVSRALAMGRVPVKPGMQRITGPVTVNGKLARQGMLLGPGDTVVTGLGGEAIYVIGSDAFLQRAESTVTFGQNAATFLRVLSGRLLSVFGKGARNLVIPAATIGIRGTGCYIEAAEARSYFCLCYGTVEVRPSNERPLEYETTHHENPLWIEDGRTVRAPVINHTDEELTMLEQLVARWPPFYNAPDPNPY